MSISCSNGPRSVKSEKHDFLTTKKPENVSMFTDVI